jgi:hypothetical protein
VIETLIFIYGEKRSIMAMIFWAWIGFMTFIGLMLSAFGEWGHIPVSISLALVIWIVVTMKW